MNRSYVTGFGLIAAVSLASCSDDGNLPTTPTGGAPGIAGAGSGFGGTAGSAGTGVGGGLGTSGQSGFGGSVPGSSGAATAGASAGGGGGAAGASGGGAGPGGAGASGSAGAAGSGGGGGTVTRSAGCDKPPQVTSGTKTIQSGGKSRSYMIRVPEGYDNTHAYWLIFGFHWRGGNANDVDSGGTSGYTWSYYGLREQADKSTTSRAIFVAPNGLNGGWGNSNNEDVVLTDDILKQVTGGLCVDTKHIFSAGFSWGGGMTKALGCTRPDVFRALAVYAGADFLSGGCDANSKAPIAFFGAHSVTDPTNGYDSGITILNRFAQNNGCTAQTPPQPAQGSLTHVCTDFAGCKAGYPTRWCAFNGGGHTPAPVDGSSNDSGGGDKTWTKGEVWKFFTQFQ
jgi:poly(3-hydroxybutyrate) depolymerase